MYNIPGTSIQYSIHAYMLQFLWVLGNVSTHISVVRGMRHLHTPPTVHSQGLPGDEGCLGGGQEQDGGGNLLSTARSSKRMETSTLLNVSRSLLICHAAPAEDVRYDHTRVNGVHPNSIASNLKSVVVVFMRQPQ